MKMMRLWALGFGLWAGTACADLTAVVTPGYQFPLDGSVAPAYDLLNLLGQPTIQIYGTIGGSNTLAAGSVTGVQLNSSVADGVTVGFNGNNPPGLQTLGAGSRLRGGGGLRGELMVEQHRWAALTVALDADMG